MSKGGPKQIVYRYNGHMSTDEIRYDVLGIVTHTKGDILLRHGLKWEVDSIQDIGRKEGLDPLPTLFVFLVELPVHGAGRK